jgi:hypothetical protein
MARRKFRTSILSLTSDSSSAAPGAQWVPPGSGRIVGVSAYVASGTVEYQGIAGDPWVDVPSAGIVLDGDLDRTRSADWPVFRVKGGGAAVMHLHWKLEAHI